MRLSTYARLAVRLVNSAGDGQDRLTSVADVPGLFVEQPVWRIDATPDDIARLRELRRDVRAIFVDAGAGEHVSAVRRLNALLDSVTVRPRVTGHDGEPWHMHVNEEATSMFDGFASVSIVGLAAYLVDFGIERLGVCEAARCENVFLDSSSNISRRYCTERCASRANVAAYRARRRHRPVRG